MADLGLPGPGRGCAGGRVESEISRLAASRPSPTPRVSAMAALVRVGVEGGGKLGACQGAHIGEGAGKGQEHGGQQQQDPAGLPPAPTQLPDGEDGRHRPPRPIVVVCGP